MRYLLDTHAFLWFINGDNQLSFMARQAIQDTANDKMVSIASLWEISIKLNIGKLQLDMPYKDLMWHMNINGFQLLPVQFEHTTTLTTLELHHGDPFDRIIISQALTEDLTVISRDKNFNEYRDLKLLW